MPDLTATQLAALHQKTCAVIDRRAAYLAERERDEFSDATAAAEWAWLAACHDFRDVTQPSTIAALVEQARLAEQCWCGVYRCIHNDADAGHPFDTEHPRAARAPSTMEPTDAR
jgi:hypothetical protein